MQKKPKFFITTTIPATFVFYKDNLRYLNEHFEVCAISSQKDELVKVGKEEGVKTAYIPMKREISLWNDVISFLYFLRLFWKERPEIVHGNTPKAAMLSMLAAKLIGVKVRIYMCHGLRYEGASGRLKWILMQMEKLTCISANRVICVSQGVQETLISEKISKAEKTVIIHHGSAAGIDLNKFNRDKIPNRELRKNLGILPTDFVFVFVGRIVQDKGINELIHAFLKLHQRFSTTHLLLVGVKENKMNPISEHTRTSISSNQNIHELGWQADVRPFLISTDALVLPSYREGFGMVLLEAGALGLPCITTDISGCNEIIIPGENGELIPKKDAEALYRKMCEWVENPSIPKKLGANARRLVEERYEQGVVWNTLLREYQKLLRENHQ